MAASLGFSFASREGQLSLKKRGTEEQRAQPDLGSPTVTPGPCHHRRCPAHVLLHWGSIRGPLFDGVRGAPGACDRVTFSIKLPISIQVTIHRMSKMWRRHTTGYYSAIARSGVQLVSITLSEVSQAQKDTFYRIPRIGKFIET